MDPVRAGPEGALQTRLVVLPRHTIHARCGTALERQERIPQQIDVDVVQQRRELLLLPLPCGLPYTVQPLGHAIAALSPSRARLARVPLGPRPLLHPLRRRFPGIVRRLHRYVWRGLTSPARSSSASAPRLPDAGRPVLRLVRPEISRFPCKERACMPGSTTTPGRPGACDNALVRVAFRDTDGVGTRIRISFAAQWLACTYPCQRFADTSRCLRMTRGQRGSLHLHRCGLAPPTPCRSPGAPV